MDKQSSAPSNLTLGVEEPLLLPTDLKSRLKASYDAIAPTYNEWTIPHSTARLHYLDQLLDRLPSSSSSDSLSNPVSVLELGCGCGVPVTQKLLSHTNFIVTANDLSSAQIQLARDTLLPKDLVSGTGQDQNQDRRLTLLEGDMLALDFPPASFDAVVAMYSIIHLPRAEQVEMLRKIASWLKPDGAGWMLANFGAHESASGEAQTWLNQEKGWMFWSSWGGQGTLEKIRDVGLQVVMEETKEDEVDDSTFSWILARKK